jgi:thiamine biosynthesis protein ThiS
MKLLINGQPEQVADSSSVAQVLTHLGLTPERVVIELNREILNPAELEKKLLYEGDTLEIIQFVGGG